MSLSAHYPWLAESRRTLFTTVEAIVDQFHSGDLTATPRLPRVKYKAIHVPTYLQGVRTAAYAFSVSRRLKCQNAGTIALATALRDIGKIEIRGLDKPGPLDTREMQEIYRHGEVGNRLIRQIDSEIAGQLEPAILTHHERLDGSGYPYGEQQIPLEGRVVGVLDVIDALTNPRPYGPRWSWSSVLAYLRQEAGQLYDAEVVEAVVERTNEFWVIESMCQSYEQDLMMDRQ